MNTFLERLTDEHEQLSYKVIKLEGFIKNNPAFRTIDIRKRMLLKTQLDAMSIYLDILQERIVDLLPKENS